MESFNNVADYFLVCREIEECIFDRKKIIKSEREFKELVNFCYKNSLFKFMDGSVYDISDLYSYLNSINSFNFFSNWEYQKMNFVIDIMKLYEELYIDVFFKIVYSESFWKILKLNITSERKIDRLKNIILDFEKFKEQYDVFDFSNLVFYSFYCSEYKHLSLVELSRTKRISLDAVKALSESNSRDYEDLVLIKIIDKAGLKFDLETVSLLYPTLKVLGSSKEDACEVYAFRNDIVLSKEVYEDERILDLAFNTFFKNYVVVEAFGRIWGCKVN